MFISMFVLCNSLCVCVCLQHVLILVKMIVAFVIPDEPDWISLKKQQIEFHSVQALKQQVG